MKCKKHFHVTNIDVLLTNIDFLFSKVFCFSIINQESQLLEGGISNQESTLYGIIIYH